MIELDNLFTALFTAAITSAGFLVRRYFDKKDKAGSIQLELIHVTACADLLPSELPPPDPDYYAWNITAVVFATHSGDRPVIIRQDKVRGVIEGGDDSIKLSWGHINPEDGSAGIIKSGSDLVVKGSGRLVISLSGSSNEPPPDPDRAIKLTFTTQTAGDDSKKSLTQRLRYVGDGPNYEPGGWMLGDPSDQPFRQWSGDAA